MPNLPPGTEVALRPEARRRLAFPPGADLTLLVAVHEAALKAPHSPHTQVVGFDGGYLEWAGALSEPLLEVVAEGGGDLRQLLGDAMGTGSRLWDVIWPGELLVDPERGALSTVYQGERPWVVIGETATGDLLAAPLNDATNPLWFTPVLEREEILFPGSSKDAQLELAHVWSLPASEPSLGTISSGAQEEVLSALRAYF